MTGRNKHSITIAGHRTSISLDDTLWTALGTLAQSKGRSVAALVKAIDKGRGQESLSAAIRLYVLERARGDRNAV
jgi:predicted DNA-binding ribbon-helix-helix protein